MAASDAAPLLLGAAAIGAGGAVLAQVVTSAFTGRREARRLEWERGRQDREWEIRRAERFLDLKRELYSDYLAHADEWVSFIIWAEDPSELPQPERPDPGKLHRDRANIRLVAPRDVYVEADTAALGLIGAAWELSTVGRPTDPSGGIDPIGDMRRARAQAAEARQALTKARRAMRADLRGEKEGYFGVRLDEKVPPDPPPAQARSGPSGI
jgi:hypothetical protein